MVSPVNGSSQIDAPEEKDEGMMSKVTGMMGKQLGKVFTWVDNPQVPRWQRNARRIFFNVVLIGLAVGFLFSVTAMMGGGGAGTEGLKSALLNPGLTTILMILLPMAAGGIGLAWLFESIIGGPGSKGHHTCAKVLAVALPVLLLAASAAFLVSTFGMNGATSSAVGMSTMNFQIGLMLAPLALTALALCTIPLMRTQRMISFSAPRSSQ